MWGKLFSSKSKGEASARNGRTLDTAIGTCSSMAAASVCSMLNSGPTRSTPKLQEMLTDMTRQDLKKQATKTNLDLNSVHWEPRGELTVEVKQTGGRSGGSGAGTAAPVTFDIYIEGILVQRYPDTSPEGENHDIEDEHKWSAMAQAIHNSEGWTMKNTGWKERRTG